MPHAARGPSNARIARRTGVHLDTVSRWRGRFASSFKKPTPWTSG
ncbi:helix-turn-helix domain-containing protein [Streptomyces collinus]